MDEVRRLPVTPRTRPIVDMLVECFPDRPVKIAHPLNLRGELLRFEYMRGRRNPTPSELIFSIRAVTAQGTLLFFETAECRSGIPCRLQWESGSKSWSWTSTEPEGFCIQGNATLVKDPQTVASVYEE